MMRMVLYWPEYGLHGELEVKVAAVLELKSGQWTVYRRDDKTHGCYIIHESPAGRSKMATMKDGKTAREFKSLKQALSWLLQNEVK